MKKILSVYVLGMILLSVAAKAEFVSVYRNSDPKAATPTCVADTKLNENNPGEEARCGLDNARANPDLDFRGIADSNSSRANHPQCPQFFTCF